jgi:hypothetical protein
VIHRKHRTGFEESKDFPIRINDLIAGRYQVRWCALSGAAAAAAASQLGLLPQAAPDLILACASCQ